MKERYFALVLFFSLTASTTYCQQGTERYNFDGSIIFAFDSRTNDYRETARSDIKGEITISYLNNTVEINSLESRRKFQLMKVDIENGTFRTMLHLNESGKRYVLAIATKQLTLIGIDDRVTYNKAL